MKSSRFSIVAIVLLACMFFGALPAIAQIEQSEVRAVIDQLFTGMRSGDSTLVRKSFTTDATLQSVVTGPNGATDSPKSSVEGFIKAVGTPHNEIWDEQAYDVVIHIDGPMATAWVPYKFYRGGQFSHCGVNALTLIKLNNGWKIGSITDTRRKEQCL